MPWPSAEKGGVCPNVEASGYFSDRFDAKTPGLHTDSQGFKVGFIRSFTQFKTHVGELNGTGTGGQHTQKDACGTWRSYWKAA